MALFPLSFFIKTTYPNLTTIPIGFILFGIYPDPCYPSHPYHLIPRPQILTCFSSPTTQSKFQEINPFHSIIIKYFHSDHFYHPSNHHIPIIHHLTPFREENTLFATKFHFSKKNENFQFPRKMEISNFFVKKIIFQKFSSRKSFFKKFREENQSS